jgi:hypothetical protein
VNDVSKRVWKEMVVACFVGTRKKRQHLPGGIRTQDSTLRRFVSFCVSEYFPQRLLSATLICLLDRFYAYFARS